MDRPEIINIGLNDDNNSNIRIDLEEIPSSNMGAGVELLMNEKKISKGGSMSNDININELNELESELNNLSDSIGIEKEDNVPFSSVSFDLNSNKFDQPANIGVGDNINSGIGRSTSIGMNKDAKTWDGFGKFNDVPINPDANTKKTPEMSKEELLHQKFKYLRKLEDLENKGVQLTKKYTMESSLSEMQGEYENIINEKQKSNSVKFQGKMLMAMITGLEFLNNRFDPFDLKLDGWAEQINEGIDDYDELFGELHEKYKSKAKMAPEVKLLFQLGGGAMMLHMSNTMFKSAMPGMDDIMRQNPELMQQFTQAAVNSMGDSKPGFSNFMNDVMHEEPVPERVNPFQQSAPVNRPSSSVREAPERSMRNDISEPRSEMKGPSDISDILGGIKTKTVNIKNPNNDEGSTVSLSELRDMNDTLRMPKKSTSNRRKKSDKNTVSLSL
jgi:hypothetical protein